MGLLSTVLAGELVARADLAQDYLKEIRRQLDTALMMALLGIKDIPNEFFSQLGYDRKEMMVIDQVAAEVTAYFVAELEVKQSA